MFDMYIFKEHFKNDINYIKEQLGIDITEVFKNKEYNDLLNCMDEIKIGLNSGLTKEQVLLYAKPCFNEYQMREIREGFSRFKLSMKQVKLYAKPEFRVSQMEQIKLGFINGLTIKQVSVYAKPEFHYFKMEEIRNGFENGLTIEQIMVGINQEFDVHQMSTIYYGFEEGLTMEQVLMYAKPEFTKDQMNIILYSFKIGLTTEQVSILADRNFSDTEMSEIINIIKFCDENNKELTKEIVLDKTLSNQQKLSLLYSYKYLKEKNYNDNTINILFKTRKKDILSIQSRKFKNKILKIEEKLNDIIKDFETITFNIKQKFDKNIFSGLKNNQSHSKNIFKL